MHPHAPAPRQQRGLTLVETSIVLAVTGILIGAAAPSIQRAIERRHVEGAAAQLRTDLAHARSLAVARNRSVRISFDSGTAGSCYIVHTGAAGDCRCDGQGATVCSGSGEALRSMHFQATGPVTLRSNVSSVLADASRGTVTPTATVAVQGRSGLRLNAVVNIMGRVRVCSVGGGLPGYVTC